MRRKKNMGHEGWERQSEREITVERRRGGAAGGITKFTYAICASKVWLCWLVFTLHVCVIVFERVIS